MTFVNHHHGCCGFVPTHPDGTEWAHLLVREDGAVIHADSAAEVLAELIPGYERADSEIALIARMRHAERRAVAVQRPLLDDARRNSPDQDATTWQDLATVLDAPKEMGIVLTTDESPDEQAAWLGPVPLVAVTSSYAPHTEIPPVRGRIIWIDPIDEDRYLASLGAAGAYAYWSAAGSGAIG